MISGNLEYLMSSLPYLSFRNDEEIRSRVSTTFQHYTDSAKEARPLTDMLDSEAEKYLMPKAFKLLRQLDLNTIYKADYQGSKNGVLSAFSKYAHSLREAVRQLRVARKAASNGSTQQKYLLPLTPGSPLEEEIHLMKLQWDKLEALSVGHYADFSALVIYKLKLLILIRWWSFNIDEGFATFSQLTKQHAVWPTRS